ncbi:MAG: response regulator [Rhodospirillales bacterium]|nr:response regulator [Rhodospirillales bacterium]MBO6788135.1 response regulator [Rhodospirillales bacterium]
MSDYLRDVSIMVVEDQEFTASLLRKMLRVLGASNVHMFTNGEDAWHYFKHNSVDLVLTDWQMAPINGIQLTQLIRKDPESPNTFAPIIMVTAFREREHVFKARDAGVTEYVIKPLSPKGLFSRLEAVIERPRRFVRVGEFFGPDRRRHHGDFKGPDRRGHGAPPPKKLDAAAAAKAKKQEMQQDEINTTFNPDDVDRVKAN